MVAANPAPATASRAATTKATWYGCRSEALPCRPACTPEIVRDVVRTATPDAAPSCRSALNRVEARPVSAGEMRAKAAACVLAEATEAAGGLDVRVGGGVSTARAFLRAGLVDHLHVMIAPILLGRGNRLWDDLRGLELTHKVTTEVAESGTTHVTFTR